MISKFVLSSLTFWWASWVWGMSFIYQVMSCCCGYISWSIWFGMSCGVVCDEQWSGVCVMWCGVLYYSGCCEVVWCSATRCGVLCDVPCGVSWCTVWCSCGVVVCGVSCGVVSHVAGCGIMWCGVVCIHDLYALYAHFMSKIYLCTWYACVCMCVCVCVCVSVV